MSDSSNNKLILKALLMKNIKTDNKGRVLLSKGDEWRNETIWDDINKAESLIISTQESLEDIIPIDWSEEVLSGKEKVLIDNNTKVSKAIKKCSKKYKQALNNLDK